MTEFNELKSISDVVIIFGAIESLLHNLAKRTATMEDEGEEAETVKRRFQQLALDITRYILEDHIRYYY